MKKLLQKLAILFILYLIGVFGIQYSDVLVDQSKALIHQTADYLPKEDVPDLPPIDIPLVDGKMPTQINSPYQWGVGDMKYVYVSSLNTAAYTRPDTDSPIYTDLAVSQRVRVVYMQMEVKLILGYKTKWVFVVDPKTLDPLGWVPSAQLAYKVHFKPLRSWANDRFTFCKDEFCGDVTISNDGSFKTLWGSEGAGLILEGVREGQLYQYKSLIWLKGNDVFTGLLSDDVFILDENGQLAQELRYGLRPIEFQ